jgi:nucleotide-binding universal stress UspA family protein
VNCSIQRPTILKARSRDLRFNQLVLDEFKTYLVNPIDILQVVTVIEQLREPNRAPSRLQLDSVPNLDATAEIVKLSARSISTVDLKCENLVNLSKISRSIGRSKLKRFTHKKLTYFLQNRGVDKIRKKTIVFLSTNNKEIDMFKKILVAIDRSEMSHDVFKTALDIAKADRAILVLLHVMSFDERGNPAMLMPTGMEYFQAADPKTLEIYRDQLQSYEHQSLEILKSLADRATAEGVTTEVHQLADSPGRRICEFADSEEIDLIVMGRRGLSGVNEFLMGSVSNYVLHHAPCSVLIDKK